MDAGFNDGWRKEAADVYNIDEGTKHTSSESKYHKQQYLGKGSVDHHYC